MNQEKAPIDARDTVLHFVVHGCEVNATFSIEPNQTVYQQIKQILVDTCTRKVAAVCNKYDI